MVNDRVLTINKNQIERNDEHNSAYESDRHEKYSVVNNYDQTPMKLSTNRLSHSPHQMDILIDNSSGI